MKRQRLADLVRRRQQGIDLSAASRAWALDVWRAGWTGFTKAVALEDWAVRTGRAFLRFDNGATGSIEGNWIATGRKMQHDFEVYGTKGALAFSQERFNELHFFSTADAKGRQGFRRIEHRQLSQSRLRQMFFGGATSHLLNYATIPVLMTS